MSNVSVVTVITFGGGPIATVADALMFPLRYITLTCKAYLYRFRAKNGYIVSVENGVLGLIQSSLLQTNKCEIILVHYGWKVVVDSSKCLYFLVSIADELK